MGHLELTMLGPLTIRHGGQPVALATRKAEALLVYLTVEGRPQSRERLCALLWPDSDEDRARGSLRSTLNFIRSALRVPALLAAPAHLLAERGLVALAEQPARDTQALLEAHRLALQLPQPPAEAALTELRAALERYRGEFLEGFALPDAPEFDYWLAAQRAAWHERVALLADRLTRALEEGGALSEGVAVTTHWLAFDALNEAAYRRLMRLHYASGDREMAWRVYRTCRATLNRELEIEPSAETRALALRLRRELPDDLGPPRPDRFTPLPTTELPLVGRSVEHSQLVAAYQAALRGRPQFVLIEGEPGIGKTRLASEFLRWAAAHGAAVLQGGGLSVRSPLPYQVITQALRSRLGQVHDLRRLLGDVWLSELSSLCPELRERYPDLPVWPGDSAVRLFEAVARFVQALAQPALLLFLDDLQWIDTGSLELLQYALRRWGRDGPPLLLLATLRSGEEPRSTDLEAWLQSVRREAATGDILLGPLAREHTRRLLALLGLSQLGDWLSEATEGHPLYLTETLKALYDQGLLRRQSDGGWDLSGAPPGPDFLAPGVRGAILSRLALVSPPTRQALTAAAVLGDRFRFEPLATLASLSEDVALGALEDLLARRLLHEQNGVYRFAHDKIREVAYGETSAARRRVLHRRALTALEAANAPPAELAAHAWAAGLAEPACRWTIAAGEEALRLFAVRDAVRHLERALMLVEAADGGTANLPTSEPALPSWAAKEGPQPPLRRRLAAQLGKAYELSNNFQQATRAYENLLALAQQQEDHVQECAALNRLAGVAAHGQPDLPAAAAFLERARAVAEQHGDRNGLVETAWNRSRLSWFSGNIPSARSEAAVALALARELDAPEPIARCLNWLALSGIMAGALPEAAAQAAEAARLYALLGERAMEADSLVQLASARNRLGRSQEAMEPARRAKAIAEAVESPWGRADSSRELALALFECGHEDDALQVAERAVELAREANYTPLLVTCLGLLGSIQRGVGHRDQAQVAHQEIWRLAGPTPHPSFLELAASELCADMAAIGNWDEAAEWARRASSSRSPALIFFGEALPVELEALLRAGERELAGAELAGYAERAQRSPRFHLVFLRATAVLADHDGDDSTALQALDEARRLAKSLGLPRAEREIGEQRHMLRCPVPAAVLPATGTGRPR